MRNHGGSDYPSDWDSRRRKVYRRDEYTCQNCGAKGGPRGNAELHAHHIVPKKNGGSDQISNLQTLCKQCHDAIHNDNRAPTTTRSNLTDTGNSGIDRLGQFPLDRSEYPQKIRPHIQVANKLADIDGLTEDLGEEILKMSNLAERYLDAGSRDLEIPTKLSNRYRDARNDVNSILDELRSICNYLEVVNTENFSEETLDSLRIFKNDLEEYIQNVTDLIDILDELARLEEESTDWNSIDVNSIDVSMAIDDLETESISNSGSNLLTKLYRRIQRAGRTSQTGDAIDDHTTSHSGSAVDDYIDRHDFNEK